jgi:hypothetical protein
VTHRWNYGNGILHTCKMINCRRNSAARELCCFGLAVKGTRRGNMAETHVEQLCFLWGTNWIYICHVEEIRPPLWSSGQSSWLQNGDVLCFLWGTNWIYVCYVEESRVLLWSSGQSSWVEIQRSGFDSRRYHIFWEIVSLERCPLSLVEYNWGATSMKK